jgi:hypothetical protein
MPKRAEGAGPYVASRASGWQLPRSDLTAALFTAVLAAGSILDEAHPTRAVLLALVLVPLGASLLLGPRLASVFAAGCLLLAFVLPDSLYEHGQLRYVRVSAIAGMCLLSAGTAWWRDRATHTYIEASVQGRVAERTRRAALSVNDAIVQDLVAASTWLDLGQAEAARQPLARALGRSSSLVRELLGDAMPEPGDLTVVATMGHEAADRTQ